MLAGIVMSVIVALIFASLVVNIAERKYQVNLLEVEDAEKLRRHKVSRLELKRYAITWYVGSLRTVPPPKRRQVSLNAPDQSRAGMLNTVTDELHVLAYVKNGTIGHDVFVCPYSQENKARLLEIVAKYNG